MEHIVEGTYPGKFGRLRLRTGFDQMRNNLLAAETRIRIRLESRTKRATLMVTCIQTKAARTLISFDATAFISIYSRESHAVGSLGPARFDNKTDSYLYPASDI